MDHGQVEGLRKPHSCLCSQHFQLKSKACCEGLRQRYHERKKCNWKPHATKVTHPQKRQGKPDRQGYDGRLGEYAKPQQVANEDH